PGLLTGDVTMSLIATFVSEAVGRKVVDRTRLDGAFVVDLHWAFDTAATDASGNPERASDPDAPSIFTALREQVGLKLESAKSPVDVLVIDHIERPGPD